MPPHENRNCLKRNGRSVIHCRSLYLRIGAGSKICKPTTIDYSEEREDQTPSEDSSRDQSYKLFFLKNLAIRFSRDFGYLPRGSFLPYILKSGGDVFSSIREFRVVKRWVDINRYRFKQDSLSVTELWELPE